MLKKFFLNFLSSFVGAWVALGLFCLAAVIVVISLVGKMGASMATDTERVRSNSVLTINLDGVIAERETAPDFSPVNLINGDISVPTSLNGLVAAIGEAKDNKDVRMIYLKCNGVAASPATLHALRDALVDFKESNKKIYAYGNSLGLGDYYVASVADSLFLNPAGAMSVNGMNSMVPYFKELLDKVGVQMQVVKVGTFKSAVEPYISNEMSAPARAQLDTLYGNIWNFITAEICKSRRLTEENFSKLINQDVMMLQDAKFAEKNKVVDKIVYERTMDDCIASALGVNKKKVNYISPAILNVSSSFGLEYTSSNQIAVLYAVGEIMEGSKTGINCEVLVPVITRLADDDDVKGLVLRVNSPGGSVFGSDLIGEALDYFKSKGKPLAVSMGDYAASGGYWISCKADRIFSDPLTITGSIGIFGMIPNVSGLAGKIGVSPQFVSTNPEVDFPSLFRPMTESQMALMQGYINRGYDKFVGRVAKGRNLSDARVRQIAEGRVWDGAKALDLKLVDQLGQLDDAIDWVQGQVDKKGGKKCDVAFYPEIDSNFWSLVQMSLQNEMRASLIEEATKLVPDAEAADALTRILSRKPVQARMMPMKVTLQ